MFIICAGVPWFGDGGGGGGVVVCDLMWGGDTKFCVHLKFGGAHSNLVAICTPQNTIFKKTLFVWTINWCTIGKCMYNFRIFH